MSETKTCPFCGEGILAAAKKCKHCGEFLDGRPRQASEPAGASASARETYGGAEYFVPMMKNGWALGARFCAYFAFLPGLGFLAGIVAIVLALLGLSYCRRNPGALGKGSSIFALVWSGAWMLFWAVIFLIAAAK